MEYTNKQYDQFFGPGDIVKTRDRYLYSVDTMTTVNRPENIALLESISALVPSQGITPPVFARLYPDATDGKRCSQLYAATPSNRPCLL
jgi:hypothetical protein